MVLQIFQDALFSAIAAIGFAAISNPAGEGIYILRIDSRYRSCGTIYTYKCSG